MCLRIGIAICLLVQGFDCCFVYVLSMFGDFCCVSRWCAGNRGVFPLSLVCVFVEQGLWPVNRLAGDCLWGVCVIVTVVFGHCHRGVWALFVCIVCCLQEINGVFMCVCRYVAGWVGRG